MLQIADYISKRYSGKLVEVGIGYNWIVALKLKENGFRVVATDIRHIPIKDIEFYIDDITTPRLEIYSNSSLIYSIRPPPEIVPHILRVAKEVKADVLIRPFGNEFYSGKLINYRGERFYVWRDGIET
ncbi:UPF0146 family protein [Archaeoglobus profundus]|uniref:UPF0146 protein Arcpr_0446 n=1 Tax=Archaeoglobus profundus (strain DSM 5631 / JCM 9629 / NBRC 100127 / Av18) TaxID=572546 RepID=D2RGT8_ARCPA|nr:UPF0146 family protein [Archaeoglobus profundus]ADB57513.1 Protein of unknown function UPF0146 [Archaeoglobus profundus DSM 5631]